MPFIYWGTPGDYLQPRPTLGSRPINPSNYSWFPLGWLIGSSKLTGTRLSSWFSPQPFLPEDFQLSLWAIPSGYWGPKPCSLLCHFSFCHTPHLTHKQTFLLPALMYVSPGFLSNPPLTNFYPCVLQAVILLKCLHPSVASLCWKPPVAELGCLLTHQSAAT